MTETPSPIDQQRALIDEVDRAIIELVARRRDLVARLFETKRRLGIPLVDPDRETLLVSRWRTLAMHSSVPPLLADEILRVLLDDSHARA